jgi:hypothetical protein
MDNFTSSLLQSSSTVNQNSSFKDLVLLRSEADLVTLEDDSIILDLFTNSLTNNSVNVFSSTNLTTSQNFPTSFIPLVAEPKIHSSSNLVVGLTINDVFSRDLISLLKIY